MPADDGAATITVDGAKEGRPAARHVDRRMLIDGELVRAGYVRIRHSAVDSAASTFSG